jgi:ABC-2 type transport system ATP-binding protein
MIMKNVVEVLNVSKTFKHNRKRFFALKDISFSLKKGEIFGLLGPNGAGKTTLVNILTTALLPDSGTVKIFGLDACKKRYDILERINAVSGETKFNHKLKVNEIIGFYSKLYNIDKDERKKRIKYIFDKLEIESLKDKMFQDLSQGQKMRVIIAKSLINNPELLLLDEPTIGLDPDIAVKIRKLIKRINRKDKVTILLTSHYMYEVENLCNRIAFINKGRILDIGGVKKVKMRSFGNYEVRIKVRRVKNIRSLKSRGFKIRNKVLIKKLRFDEDPSQILKFLVSRDYDVVSMETRYPTLDDYFLEMVDKK